MNTIWKDNVKMKINSSQHLVNKPSIIVGIMEQNSSAANERLMWPYLKLGPVHGHVDPVGI